MDDEQGRYIMPNWCENRVVITGDVKVLTAIKEAADRGGLLEHLAPIGEYDYGVANSTWNTKWEVHDVEVSLFEDGKTSNLHLGFDSAWGPPTGAYDIGSDRLGISIEASYYESGIGFIGEYDSTLDINNTYSVEFNNDDWKDSIPTELIEEFDLDGEYVCYQEWQEENDE
ncbi:hypothetical protein OAF92_01350 [bacterium]|nr:hypothetical protein [bacterium]